MKIVHYKPHPDNTIFVGVPAIVQPTDHTSTEVSNAAWVYTSRVIEIRENGDFITQNTHYVLQEDL